MWHCLSADLSSVLCDLVRGTANAELPVTFLAILVNKTDAQKSDLNISLINHMMVDACVHQKWSGEKQMLLVLLCSYAAIFFFCLHFILSLNFRWTSASSLSTQGTLLRLHLKGERDVTEALTARQHVISALVYSRVCTKTSAKENWLNW